ncbi:MAG: hypothetical protein ACE5EH_06445 [Gammaproteobacteria bacterium]
MKLTLTRLAVLLPMLLFVIPTAFAGSDHHHGNSHAIQNMAKIMSHLNHYPSDSEKDKLRKIAGDSASSAHERTIANAMINLEHHVSSADRQKLRQIVEDDHASDSERNLAEIVMNLNHKPSRGDKEKLMMMMK